MRKSLQVLLVEDSESDAKFIVRQLRHNAEEVRAYRVDNAADLRAALEKGHWDLIICDWSLPGFSALGAIKIVRQEKGLDLPLIIVSGTMGEEAAVESMRAGAHDYVLKDRLARLSPAVEREIHQYEARVARRQSEEKLRVSEARFARLSESGIIGINVSEISGRICEANDAYLKLIGATREELMAGTLRWDDRVPDESRAVTAQSFDLLMVNGVAPPFESEIIRSDGARVPVLVAVAMLDMPYCIALVVDLSERRKAEVALRRTEDQLRQAQKMEAVGILAGGVAHDFNNILSVILGYSDLMLENLPDDDPHRADLTEIRDAGERGSALTRQLLAFSRQQIIQPRIIDLNEILVGTEKMLHRLIREDITLSVKLDPTLGRCKGDPGQIEQIAMNLVVNARDAMPDGGTLLIETQNVVFDEEYARSYLHASPGRYVMLAVTDSGTGMSRATQSRIFEPFFTTKEKGKGTGLGLSTVFGIVEQSGGCVRVYSELGQGSTFKIYLPRTDAPMTTDTASVEVNNLRGTETILLVEDEEQIRKVTFQILKRQGYQVIEATNGVEALKLCEQQGQIDLLLTDIMMPLMNGKQLADKLANLRPGTKVLFMSGYTEGALVGQLAAGSAFVQKPVTPSSLAKRVRELLDS